MRRELTTGTLVAGWRLLRAVGEGAQSAVFLAEPAAGGAAVALKLVSLGGTDAATRAAFLVGAQTAQRLVHPHIVAVLGAGIERDIGWLAMEPVPGTTLVRYTRPPRLLPEPLVVEVAQAVAAALELAHGQGVVHRDIKPANILVHWQAGIVKLADFGLARAADAGRTATGLVLGSPGYMAPEQLAGNQPTPASDFYALGVTLFELLAGRLPHEADTLGELLRKVAADPAPQLRTLQPGVPAPLAALVARLLAKAPAQRPSDAAELLRELAAVRRALPAAGGAKSRA